MAETYESRSARSRQLLDMARSSFAQSCDEILNRYGMKVAPKRRQDSSSITSSSAAIELPEAKNGNITQQDSVTTTSSSSLPYMSLNDNAPSTSIKAEHDTNIPKIFTRLKESNSAVDNSPPHDDTEVLQKYSQRRLSTAEGATSKLLQMSFMKLQDSTGTNDTADLTVTNSNSLDLQGNYGQICSNCM